MGLSSPRTCNVSLSPFTGENSSVCCDGDHSSPAHLRLRSERTISRRWKTGSPESKGFAPFFSYPSSCLSGVRELDCVPGPSLTRRVGNADSTNPTRQRGQCRIKHIEFPDMLKLPLGHARSRSSASCPGSARRAAEAKQSFADLRARAGAWDRGKILAFLNRARENRGADPRKSRGAASTSVTRRKPRIHRRLVPRDGYT